MPDVSQILAKHVRLEVSCVDRIYLGGFMPILQTPGQLVYFLTKHLGKPIPSPALLGQITEDFRRSVDQFAQEHDVPVRKFAKGERKDDVAAWYRHRFTKPEGVYLIGTAQEKASAFYGRQEGRGGHPFWRYSRRPVFVTHYYFYLVDRDFGPAFIKVCTYAPFAVKVCLNGHEWAKRGLEKRGIPYEALDNGFLSCSDPEKLQRIGDSFAHTPDGFSNQELRKYVAGLLDPDAPSYGRNQMTYDLRRLRLKGMIQRLPGKNRYMLTRRGIRWALFLTKVYSRIVRPFSRRHDPPLPEKVSADCRAAFDALDASLERVIKNASLVSSGASAPLVASRQSPAASR